MRAGGGVDDRVGALLLDLAVIPPGFLAAAVLEEPDPARPFCQRLARIGGFEDDLHPLPVALVQVVELVEVPEEPVLDGESGAAGLAGDVGVGDRRRLAFALQLGEVPGVLAGIAERVAGDVEVVPVAEFGDVGRGRPPFQRRFVAVLVGFGQLDRGVAEHRADAGRLVLLAVGVADLVAFADHQPRRVGLDQALFGGLGAFSGGASAAGKRKAGEHQRRHGKCEPAGHRAQRTNAAVELWVA